MVQIDGTQKKVVIGSYVVRKYFGALKRRFVHISVHFLPKEYKDVSVQQVPSPSYIPEAVT